MRANDIELLRDHGASPQLIRVLREMYEQQKALEQSLKALVKLTEAMIDLTGQTVLAASKLGHDARITQLKTQGIEVSSDPALTGAFDEDMQKS